MVLTKEQVAVLRELVNANEWNMGVWNNATGRNLPENMTGLLDTIDDSGRAIRVQKRALELAMRAFLHPDKADETIREFIAMYVEQAEREEAE